MSSVQLSITDLIKFNNGKKIYKLSAKSPHYFFKKRYIISLNNIKNANLKISLSFLKFNNLLIPKIMINNVN